MMPGPPERYRLQSLIGDVATGHPEQLRRRSVAADQFNKIAVLADHHDFRIMSGLKYLAIRCVSEPKITQGSSNDIVLFRKPLRQHRR